MNANEKLPLLQKRLKQMGSVIIAFSGGVDSSFLLRAAKEQLGNKVLAVTAVSETYPRQELLFAEKLAASLGVHWMELETDELSNPNFFSNPPERCYYCKQELFSKLVALARDMGYGYILDGANADDTTDFRPGIKAGKELGIISPLKEAGLTKEEIRSLSRLWGLPSWDKPSQACLSSRFPYGHRITIEKLKQVEEGEDFLRSIGFRQLRVRHHGEIARIELAIADLAKITDSLQRKQIVDHFKNLGFTYITLDLAGFRSGSMNEVLPVSITQGEEYGSK
ncbi:MAG: ATP-dependent sacrificial sulfur transferase LarE [Clostridia bacterium]|nr:ATP-dependent sacrificial sulfur transferase LarE [Clostridia bacterium]